MKNLVYVLVLAMILCPFTMAQQSNQKLPTFLNAKDKQPGDFQKSDVLYAGEGFTLKVNTARAEVSAQSNISLYAARYLNVDKVLPKLAEYGTILFLSKDKREAILKIDDPLDAEDLAGYLHEHAGTMGCGALIKLATPQEIVAQTKKVSSFVQSDALIDKALTLEASPKIKQMANMVEPDNIRQFVQELSNYKNRHHRSSSGKAAADHIYNTFAKYTQSNSNLTVKQVRHSNTPQPSVVATLRGTTKPEEVVIVGCHIDSINGGGSGAVNRVAPGADDNASGTAAVKEVLRIIATHGYKFKRTLEFHGYAAEEIGLVGSAGIASSYKSKSKNVVGMIQIDMCIYSADSIKKIWLVSNDTNSKHNQLAGRLIDQYCSIPWGTGSLWGGTSDHRSWSRRGYPAIFPFENPRSYNRKIHTTGDTIANSGQFDYAANYAKLALAYLSTLGELE